MASGKSDKTRNWKFVVWQESAPIDFVTRMANSFMKVNMCLHDKDKHSDGTPVKPHWDGVIMMDGPTTYDKMMRLMKGIAGDGINTIQECITTSGALKYICHLSNTDFNEDSEKYVYDTKEVVSLNGADYIRDIIKYQDEDTYDEEIMKFIIDHNISHYSTLCEWTIINQPEWYRCIRGSTLYWKGYVNSRFDKRSKSIVNELDDLIEESFNYGN